MNPIFNFIVRIFSVSIFGFALLLISVFQCHAASSDLRPYILLLFADDLSPENLGTCGGSIPTPYLDKLAEDGVYFRMHGRRPCAGRVAR